MKKLIPKVNTMSYAWRYRLLPKDRVKQDREQINYNKKYIN